MSFTGQSFTTAQFNTGLQRSVILLDNQTGQRIKFGGDLLKFKCDPVSKDVIIEPIDSPFEKRKKVWGGYEGVITVARNDATLEKLQMLQESNYYARGNQYYYTIDETTSNDDGTTDVVQYLGVTLDLKDRGEWSKTAAVECQLHFHAQQAVPMT